MGRMGVIREDKWKEEKMSKGGRHKVCERVTIWSLRSESTVKHVNTSKCQLALTCSCEYHMMSTSS